MIIEITRWRNYRSYTSLKAQTDGYEKNVVIMTKPEGYEKQRNKFSGLAKILYRKYPKIAENLVDHYRFIMRRYLI